ncbi:phosphomannomutase CpsG [Escherichia coli]|uniref:Phosphomannomutase n=1 Tax=Escherichia coli TaxID=562 RepID=A0A376U7D0_ECOLX|nr:phosphomannomutase CpsG [Escherichia coli]
MKKLTCFKAYDIRGKLGEELNEDIAWRIGRAYGEFLKPKTIVLGGDVRLTSETLKLALAKGLQDAGVDVLDIGMSGTEEIYFTTFHLGVDGGIEVTASHNPMDYNGMKLVREGARPISGDTGLRDVQRLAEANDFPPVDETKRGRYQQINLRDAYVDHLFGYINVKNLTPLKLVINSGNGAAGPVVDAIEARFKALGAPVELIKVHNTPDGNFPNGIPNRYCRNAATTPAMRSSNTARIWALPLMAILTAASCLTKKGSLSKATTLSACWQKRSSKKIPARRSSTIHVSPGIPLMW